MNKKFNLRVLSTSDIHGHILAKNYADNKPIKHGLSILGNIIKEKRNKNTILIDVGDDLQGSPLMYFHQLNRKDYENPLKEVFNYLNYDYFIPGNHDFNYGLDYLEDFVENINALTLCSNIYDADGNLLFKFPYDIIKYKNGPTVGIVGLTTQYIPNWENPNYIQGLKFVNAFESLKKTVIELRSKVDCLIVAYHGGFEKDLHTNEAYVLDTGENLGSKIINNIEEIDCLITAHQHRYIAEEINGKTVIQGGSKADSLGLIDIEFIYDNKWHIKNKSSSLIETADYYEDKQIVSLIKDVENDCQEFLDKEIGNVVLDNLQVKDMFEARLDKHPIVTFINQVQLESSKAMISATSLPNEVTGFSKKITVRNVLSTYVYANTLSVLELNGKILKQILEKNAEYFICEAGQIKINPRFSYPKVQHYNYDMFDGIEYTIDITKPFGKRIKDLSYKGLPVVAEQKFSLVVNNYRASGGGDFEDYKNLKVIRQIPFDITELIIDYIIKHQDLHIKQENNIKIMSKKC